MFSSPFLRFLFQNIFIWFVVCIPVISAGPLSEHATRVRGSNRRVNRKRKRFISLVKWVIVKLVLNNPSDGRTATFLGQKLRNSIQFHQYLYRKLIFSI